MRQQLVALIAGAFTVGGCTTSSIRSSDGSPITGDWGGVHAGLTLTPSAGAIRYDCAHGGLNAPVVPDGGGYFDVAGVHVREHGGPVRLGEVPDSLPARYIGRVTSDRMQLRVVVGPDTLGPFELQLGAAPQLFRCL